MTERYRDLDTEPLSSLTQDNPLTLYRLARAKYANLSGVGAALYPGRWNRAGVEAIYTSVEQSATVLERLVHTPKDQIPSNLAMMSIELNGHWRPMRITLSTLSRKFPRLYPDTFSAVDLIPIPVEERILVEEQTGASILLCPSLSVAESDYREGEFEHRLAVALPSVVVPVWNIVLFPDSPGFYRLVSLKQVERLNLDKRLFTEGATSELSRGRYEK